MLPYAAAYGISDWVAADSVPAGAEVVDRKWVYDQRIYLDSREPNLSGYTLQNADWIYAGSGSTYYASVPSGFDTGHWLYAQLANSAYTGYQTETSWRDVSNQWTGYVYWHWMYEIGGVTEWSTREFGLNRVFNDFRGWADGYNFTVFTAFLSTNGCRQHWASNGNPMYYDCTDEYGKWIDDGQLGFWRFDYYTSSYTDYYRLFHYVRYEYNLESASPLYESDTIYNIREYAKYKNTFTVSYDANGGQGAPSAQTKTYGTALSLSALIPTKTDYEFRGWATSANAAYAEYQPGQGFEQETDTTLYAVWAYPSGKCGDTVNWTLIGDHLYLEGSGVMSGYENASAVPWRGYADRITAVTIGEEITSIGNYAFAECRNLASLSLPSTLSQVGSYAFDHCSSLKSIGIPNGVTVIADHCFQSCERLSAVTIPVSVSEIGEAAFFGCSALPALSLPTGTEHIGAYAFAACTNLTEINIPSGVKVLPAHLFDADE